MREDLRQILAAVEPAARLLNCLRSIYGETPIGDRAELYAMQQSIAKDAVAAIKSHTARDAGGLVYVLFIGAEALLSTDPESILDTVHGKYPLDVRIAVGNWIPTAPAGDIGRFAPESGPGFVVMVCRSEWLDRA